ncbi:hypothetical protein [Alterinioella nitratireducens]|uniref:hypothetical protein n=1 Tax=Alterinioella nitratireducens TaxID=2735915 RepID=UPI0015543AB2|nr:hypothetical protein [Alterinioella nitratireducens]NPD20971.1 hypothetical protein [Alterinioella nitratireducens]
MKSLFLLIFGAVAIIGISGWGSMILVAALFPAFNFKDEFVEFYEKTTGAPPSRRRLILNAYGATNYFFLTEMCWRPLTQNSIRIVPTASFIRVLLMAWIAIFTSLILWAIVLVLFILLRTYL